MPAVSKRWVIGLGVLLLAAGAAVVVRPGGCTPSSSNPAQSSPSEKVEEFVQVPVESEGAGLALSGIVYGPDGQPLAGAEVSLASSSQATLATVKCSVCGEPLLACASRASVPKVEALLRSGKGHLHPGATTTTGTDGRFRFERLSGVAFTVWASAQGHGAAVHERAAPGDPVTLHLPPLRAIGGTVVDEASNPVPGATVHVLSRRLPAPVEVTADGRGVFEAAGLGEGPFYVLASAQGFLPVAKAQVEAGPQPVRLQLPRPRVLEIEVHRDGAPVEATVTLEGDHREQSLLAKAGRARVADLHPEEIGVSATAGAESAPAERVVLQDAVTKVTLQLEPAGRVAVTVLDEEGGPVPDPELSLYRIAQGAEHRVKRKARTGELVMLGPVPAGDYLLEGRAEGFRTVQLPVRVPAGGEAQMELVLPRGVTIRGRVLDEYGRPAPAIAVLVTPVGDVVRADEHGQFVAEVPSPGLYTLHAHHSDWGGADLEVNAPAEGVELQLEPKAGFRVTVLSEGRRLEGAEVLMWVEREVTWRNDRPSGSDGVVLMRGMPPGDYRVIANAKDHLPSQPRQVSLPDGDLIDLTIELQRGEALAGEVVDEDGAPVVGATVIAMPRGAEPVTTDARGQFEVRPVWPGRTYRIEAHHPNYDQRERVTAPSGSTGVRVVVHKRGLYRGRVVTERGEPVRQFRVDGRPVNAPDGRFEQPLASEGNRVFGVVEASGYGSTMIDAPADVSDVGDVVMRREPELSGTVRDAQGAPVSGAAVSCEVCEGTTVSDERGEFTLSVPAHMGQVAITASRGSLSGTAQATLSDGRSGRVEVTLRQAVRVSGRVFTANGAPAAGVELEATHIERAERFTAVTGQDGGYTLELPEGPYQFLLPRVQRPFAGEPVTFARVQGGGMSLDIGPGPGTSTVNVRVTPQNGHAVWIVRGTVPATPNAMFELPRSAWAQMVFQPRAETVTFNALPPGRYTVLWTRLREGEEAPQVRTIDVPGTRELSFVP